MSTPPLTPLAAAVLHVGAPERVLEVECGDGEAALFLAREFPAARIRGVDRSAESIRAATKRIGLDPEGRVAFKVGKPKALPYPDDHFDLLVALDAVPSAPEAARVLRLGGFLVLARTHSSEAGAGRLLGWRLSRHRIEPLVTERVGDGSFSVWRLLGGKLDPTAV
jgi:ubiquinone/menaquinone biosynthesis C-methylase UbiE